MPDERDEGRGPRAQQEAQRRRRRGDETLAASAKLPIPPEVQAKADSDGLHLRWANDEGNRLVRLTQYDDYDKVDGVEPVPVGTSPHGAPIMAHLLSKPKAFMEEDQAKAEARRRETEEALFRKPDAADGKGANPNPNPATAERYVASGTGIRRGNQVLE